MSMGFSPRLIFAIIVIGLISSVIGIVIMVSDPAKVAVGFVFLAPGIVIIGLGILLWLFGPKPPPPGKRKPAAKAAKGSRRAAA